MYKIPCEVIRDLFPSYIDGLTSEKTTQLVDEHIAECRECAEALHSMRGDADEAILPGEDDQKEIDFLKKTRLMQKIAFLSSMAAIIMAALFVILRVFIVGSSYDGTMYIVNKVSVEEGFLCLNISTSDSATVLSRVKYDEEDGVVTIKANLVPVSILKRARSEYAFKLSDPASLKQVKIGSQVIWDDGESISPLASLVYASRHDYIGDMSANGKSANAIGVYSRLGEYENQLETAAEPYGWIIRPKNDIPSGKSVLTESDMESMAYVLIGVIGNLDHVTYEYTVDGDARSLSFTAADADAFFGRSIKDCGKSARVLNELIAKTGF